MLGRKLLAASLLSFLPFPARAQAPSTGRDAGRLECNHPVEQTITPGQTDAFSVPARAGQFLHVRVEHKGIHVSLSILDPGGRELVATNNPNAEFGLG